MPCIRLISAEHETYTTMEMDFAPRIGERICMGRYMYRIVEITHDMCDDIPATAEIVRIAEAEPPLDPC